MKILLLDRVDSTFGIFILNLRRTCQNFLYWSSMARKYWNIDCIIADDVKIALAFSSAGVPNISMK